MSQTESRKAEQLLTAARAEALFASPLSMCSRPSLAEAADAIKMSMRSHGGTLGCAAEVAAVFGDYPDLAAHRMRWALATVEAVFSARRGG
ncbi:hypothetical protein Misp01_15310 [Microtetraspora sp. NBRC 13810]|uniref:hypothetical protein n=1 Tax=Microtetraspora sp. NBRC 13810 TaxID=3030990 RepID=UPI0024A4403E|nr:hypothetical protein [Microtetraspora sp. NBRC 13810]GLW06401.1 hypothetical protein Misp01_15310 [Microtetraspora sp. NBRC 13810]